MQNIEFKKIKSQIDELDLRIMDLNKRLEEKIKESQANLQKFEGFVQEKDIHFNTEMPDTKDEMISSAEKFLNSSDAIQDIIFQHDCEAEIKTSMKNLNISEIREEEIKEQEPTEENEILEEMEMTPEEIRDFVDNEKGENEFIQTQESMIKEEKIDTLNVSNSSSNIITSQKQFKQEIMEVPSGTILKVDETILKKCIEKSVKPDVKIKNKFKKIKSYLDEAMIYAKCIMGASAIISCIATPIVGEFTDDVYANHLKREAREEYVTEIYEPYTTSSLVKDEESGYYIPTYRHNWEKIVNNVHQQYENPLIGFYLIYTKLDEDCKKNDMDSVFREFNLQYATHYQNVNDLLKENNFKNFKEYAKYVDFEIYKLGAKEIEIKNEVENYTIGR